MSEYVPLFRGALGLNTRADPTRLQHDLDSGMCELAEAVNVDVTDTRRVSRRPGSKATACTSSVHSLFSVPGTTLCVNGTNLCRLESDFSLTTLRSDLTSGARMSFAQAGDRIFYANGYENGVYSLTSQADAAWVAGSYYGPRTNRTFDDPPVGSLLEHYNGHVFIADGNVLWHTEPFGYDRVDFSQNFFWFPFDLTMVRAVPDGLVVSTTQELYLLSGQGPQEFRKMTLAAYPAIKGTDVVCDTEDMDPEISRYLRGQGVIFATTRGICLAGSEGSFHNLTKQRIDYPVQSRGTAYIYRGKYVVIME